MAGYKTNLENTPHVRQRTVMNSSIKKDIKIEQNEYIVHFNVISIYPNVPMVATKILIKNWLISTK